VRASAKGKAFILDNQSLAARGARNGNSREMRAMRAAT
jgi:hypothetical protein